MVVVAVVLVAVVVDMAATRGNRVNHNMRTIPIRTISVTTAEGVVGICF